MVAEKNPEIKKVVGVLRAFSEDEENRMAAKKIEKMRRDRVAEIEFGHNKGVAEGREEKSEEIAIKMLKANLDIHIISDCTELSIEKIQSLKSELENG